MCPVPFNSARAFVALGSRLAEKGTKYVCRQGLPWMDLLLTAVGVAKRGRISSGALFYNGRHVTPRGCWYSVKMDHQVLNKFPQQIYILSRINAPPRDSVTHWPINWQSALIPSSSQELFFLVPFFGVSTVREPWASSTNRPLSHHCYWFHLELHRWRTRCC